MSELFLSKARKLLWKKLKKNSLFRAAKYLKSWKTLKFKIKAKKPRYLIKKCEYVELVYKSLKNLEF